MPVAPTVAIPVALELHVPPGVELLRVILAPTHTVPRPVIGNGSGFTVMVTVEVQPVASVYEITVVPIDTPVTTPVSEPTVATDTFVLLHVPPDVTSLRVITDPAQTEVGPVIGEGDGLTVIILVT
jgi:hypothetical protein